MERYEHEKHGWWVEIEGAADVAISEFNVIFGGFIEGWRVVASVIGENGFTDRHGQEFALDPEGEAEYLKLSQRQWRWLSKQVMQAALDEVASEKA